MGLMGDLPNAQVAREEALGVLKRKCPRWYYGGISRNLAFNFMNEQDGVRHSIVRPGKSWPPQKKFPQARSARLASCYSSVLLFEVLMTKAPL